jgi:hypothetical protein
MEMRDHAYSVQNVLYFKNAKKLLVVQFHLRTKKMSVGGKRSAHEASLLESPRIQINFADDEEEEIGPDESEEDDEEEEREVIEYSSSLDVGILMVKTNVTTP